MRRFLYFMMLPFLLVPESLLAQNGNEERIDPKPPIEIVPVPGVPRDDRPRSPLDRPPSRGQILKRKPPPPDPHAVRDGLKIRQTDPYSLNRTQRVIRRIEQGTPPATKGDGRAKATPRASPRMGLFESIQDPSRDESCEPLNRYSVPSSNADQSANDLFQNILGIAIGFSPVGDFQDIYELFAGNDMAAMLTGEVKKLSPTQRMLAGLGIVVGQRRIYEAALHMMQKQLPDMKYGGLLNPQRFEFQRNISAEEANRQYLEKYPKHEPPYKPGTTVVDVVTKKSERFYRVTSGDGRITGEFVMRENPGVLPAHFTRDEWVKYLREKYEIPKGVEISHYTIVDVPAGTPLRLSNTNNPFYGVGGGLQIQIMEESVRTSLQHWSRNRFPIGD